MQPTTQLSQDDLYQALLDRKSVRRYDSRRLSEETLTRIRESIAQVTPLVPANRFNVLVRDVATSEDLVEALGGYGRLLSPPHFLVPTIIGETHLLEDLAYRTQQVVMALTLLGLGACYIGSLGRESTLRVRFLLKREARVGAIVIFGSPTVALADRTMNAALRAAMGSNHRLPVEQIFFDASFDRPAAPPETLSPLIEAARHAPSALNVQPWRFLWHKGQLTLFVQKANPKYGSGEKQAYSFFDGGLCMANLSLAMQALKLSGQWVLLDEAEADLPSYPETLLPIARLQLER